MNLTPFRSLAPFLGVLLAVSVQAQQSTRTPPVLRADVGVVAAQEDGGPRDEGALFLLLPVGAQGVALGRAMTGLTTSEGAFWNPAGLARVGSSRFVLFRGEHVAGEATGFSAVMASPTLGALGISYGLLDFGTQATTDGSGNPVGSFTVRGHQGIFSGAAILSSQVTLGASFKLIQFSQRCRGQCPDGGISASSYAGDLGIQFRPYAGWPLHLGAMVAHVGPALTMDEVDQTESLPARYRIAAGYDAPIALLMDEEISLRVFVEMEDRLRDPGTPSFYLGSEVTAGATDQLYLRGGYIFENRNQTDGAALGLGFRYERFEFGIARSLARGGPSPDQEPVHLSLGVSFE